MHLHFLNVRNYSSSANVFDSMGDYYLAQADTVNAIEFFKKAIAIGDLSYSKDKLAEIQKGIAVKVH